VHGVRGQLGIGKETCREAARIEVVGDIEVLEESDFDRSQDGGGEVVSRVSRRLAGRPRVCSHEIDVRIRNQ
jgi:hypothetical protein